MCSDLPSSQSIDIYKRLIAASVSRTKSRNIEPVIIRNNVAGRSKKSKIVDHTVDHYESKRTTVIRTIDSQQDQCKQIKEVSVIDESRDAKMGLQIKINSYNQNFCNYETHRNGNTKPIREEEIHSSISNRHSDEVYDDDMMSVWSSFDLKTYCLNGKLKEGVGAGCMRAKSAPPRRQQYHCRNASIYFSEEVQSQRNRSSMSPRKNKKLQYVLAETTPKLFKDMPVDYEIFLKALKLEKCVPSGVSDNQIRQNINRVISRHDSAKRK